MNEMNDLEIQLRSWALRRPSARLKASIFAQPQLTGNAGREAVLPSSGPATFRLAWLAPATLALLLMGVFVNQRNFPVTLAGPSGSSTLAAVALSNQSAAAWLPGSFASEQNRVPTETFERTNGSEPAFSLDPVTARRGE